MMSNFRSEFRLGWRDLAGGTTGLAFGTGFYNPISSFFFRALEHEYGWSKTVSSLSLLSLALTALVLPLVGRLVDRYGVRPVALIAALLMTASFVWLALMKGELWMFYVVFLVSSCSAPAPARSATPAWSSPPLPCRVVPRSRSLWSASRWPAYSAEHRVTAHHELWLAQLIGFCAGLSFVGGIVAFLLIRPSRTSSRLKSSVSPAIRWRVRWARCRLGVRLAILLLTIGAQGFVTPVRLGSIEKGSPDVAPRMFAMLAGSVVASRSCGNSA